MDLTDIYRRLNRRFGRQKWWAKENWFDVLVGAILAQRTAWKNAEQALENLKKAGLYDLNAIATSDLQSVEECVRPAGFYRQKARRLKDACIRILSLGPERLEEMPLEEARKALLSIKGIGRETADSILLYGFRRPIFVVDAYTNRIFKRLGRDLDDYEVARRWFEANIPQDADFYAELHALIVRLGKTYCGSEPQCDDCPLLDICRSAPAKDKAI